MTGSPLLYLTLRSTRNRIRIRLRRLREPRYLIATLLGVGYFTLVFWGGRSDDSPGLLRTGARGPGGMDFGFAIMLFVSAMVAWIWPRASRSALPFTLAEVQHLFTAPIPRRELVRYRVLRSQIGALLASAIITLVFRPGSFAQGGTAFVGLLLLMSTINLHLTGVSLSRASRGVRAWAPRAVAAAAVVVVATTLAMHWADVTTAAESGPARVIAELDRVTSAGLAGIVLWPFRALARLPFVGSTDTFLVSMMWALMLLTVNYVWVVRTDAPFEEASAELSVKLDLIRRRGLRAAQPVRPRTRPPRTPFALGPDGRPELAILWKNLISMGRVLSWAMLLRVAPMLIFFAVMMSQGSRGSTGFLMYLCLFGAFMAMVLGPQMARSDLRQDLAALATLKTWPMRGAAIVRGEVMAPAIVLITVIYLCLTAAAIVASRMPPTTDLPDRWGWLIAVLLVAPGIVLTQLLTQNGLAVTFPSWVAIGPRAGGVDVIGQRMLVMIVVVLSLLAALLPAASLAAIGIGIVYLVTGTIVVAVGGALAGVALLVEAYAASEIIGAILDRNDIAALDAPE